MFGWFHIQSNRTKRINVAFQLAAYKSLANSTSGYGNNELMPLLRSASVYYPISLYVKKKPLFLIQTHPTTFQ